MTEGDSVAVAAGDGVMGYKVQAGPGKLAGRGGVVGNVAVGEEVVAGEVKLEVERHHLVLVCAAWGL